MAGRDLLGRPMTEDERHLLDVYEALEALAQVETLPPCAHANVLEALATLWQAVNDLALTDDRPSVC
jgi:hypothetical protein